MRHFAGNSASGALAVVCVAQFVVVLDVTIVATALPVIRTSLGFSLSGMSWVVTAYTLTFGGLLVVGGRAADLLGARFAFVAGLVVFTGASAACALAWTPAALVAARVVQGGGSALLSPAALSMLARSTEPGPARRRAVAWWTAVAAGGGASGWVLGGLLTEYLGWRTVFWVNVPIGAAALVVAARVLPAVPRRPRRRIDLAGGFLTTATLALLVWAVTAGGEHGLASPWTWGAAVLAALSALVLIRHERRAADPLLPLDILRARPITGANLTAAALTAATTAAMFLATLYVQQVLLLPPARAAVLFPAFNVAVVAGSAAGPALLRRWGTRRALRSGFGAVALGTAVLVGLPAGRPTTALLVAFAVMGAGSGAASVASTQAGTEAVPVGEQGVVAGVLNAAAQVGNTLGVALLPVLLGLGGYRAGFVGAGALALAGAAAAAIVPRTRHVVPRPVHPARARLAHSRRPYADRR